MVNQLIYIFLVVFVLVIVYNRSKEPLKAILTVTILITPWQGGLWMAGLAQDLYMSTIVYFFLFVLSFFEKNQRPAHKRFYLPALLTAGLMIIGASISASTALNQVQANRGIYCLFERYLMFYCIYNGIRKPSDVKYVLLGLFLSISFQGLLASIQFKFWDLTIGVIDQRTAGDYWRANGTFFHANAFGMFMAVIIPLALRMVLVSFKEKRKLARNFYSVVFFLGIAGLVTCQNRGSWIGFSGAMILFFILDMVTNKGNIRKYLSKFLIPLSFIAILGVVFLGDLLQTRLFKSDADIQMENRARQVEESKGLIAEHPVFGVGYQNYKEHISWEFVHNLYLLITSELGYYGLACFILLMLIWLVNIIRGCFSNNYIVRNLSFGLGTSIVIFLVASIPGPGYHLLGSKLGNHIWILIGLSAALNDVDKKYNSKKVEALSVRGNIDQKKRQMLIQSLRHKWLNVIVSERSFRRLFSRQSSQTRTGRTK